MAKKFWNLEKFFFLFPVHLYMIDINGQYQSCNPLQAKDFGLKKPADIIGMTNYDLPRFKNHPSIIEILDNNNKKVFREKKALEFYEPSCKKDGSLTQFKSYKIPLFDESQLMGLMGISFDLSHETERIENLVQKIDQTELTLKKIIDNSPEHIYWLDKENRFLGCNAKQANDFGLPNSNELIGIHVSAFQTKENAKTIIENNNRIIREGISLSTEESFLDQQGEIRYYLSKKVPLRNNSNEIMGIVGISVDITAQKKLEVSLREAKDDAEAANQAKTEFLANMRHDIRTPLSGIVGFSEILKYESKEPRIKEYAENLVASSHALLHLMDEVLEAVRVSSGEIPLLKRKFNLADTLEQVIALYQARAQEKQLELSLILDPKLPHFVIGDKIRVHRIMLELVSNALNFTDKGHVRVQAELARQKDRELVIRLMVSDSGPGIPKDKQQDIYLQFKRLTPSYQGIYKGAGLGLYVLKQFIDELGGEIYLESEPRKGSCFTCLIPLQAPLLDDDSGIETSHDLKIETPYLKPVVSLTSRAPQLNEVSKAGKRVLIVEDNAIAQKVAQAILKSLSCQVDLATSGMDALMLCKKNHYDLIFMDIGLGEGIDGYDVTHHIRKFPDPINQVPIIALTAHGGDENKQRCIEAGMDAVLTKPLTHRQAADMLKTFISRKKPNKVPKPQSDLPDTEEEMFELDQFALFDSEQALKNSGNITALTELLNLLTTELPDDLERMKKAFLVKDYATIEKIGHKIKGGAVYVNANRMKYACQYLERYWKSGQRELMDRLYLQAVKVIEETCVHVKGWLKMHRTK
ncbi:MAG: response regulator [Tatlockia sp.]|nr:response regulator [Tatlockia sp.]